VDDVEVSRMSTIRKIWHIAAMTRRVAHPAAASRRRVFADVSTGAWASSKEVLRGVEGIVAFSSEITRSSEMK
tara:strand:- start:253 stop:471 length:219 start_codon:yes stop_codon:yes gene_type:complete